MSCLKILSAIDFLLHKKRKSSRRRSGYSYFTDYLQLSFFVFMTFPVCLNRPIVQFITKPSENWSTHMFISSRCSRPNARDVSRLPNCLVRFSLLIYFYSYYFFKRSKEKIIKIWMKFLLTRIRYYIFFISHTPLLFSRRTETHAWILLGCEQNKSFLLYPIKEIHIKKRDHS